MASKHALVFGASSVGGWSLVREMLVYPDSFNFSRVIGLCHQKTPIADFFIDGQRVGEKFDLRDGLDLTKGPKSTIAYLKQIPEIEKTTHVFYTVYGGHIEANSSPNPGEVLKTVNRSMLSSAVDAVTSVCPQLESWVMQTGGKSYGWEIILMSEGGLNADGFPSLPGLHYSLPLKESNLPVASPYSSMLFYNDQYQILMEKSRGKNWKFAEVLPGIIAGHAPLIRFTNLAQLLGLWLSLYTYVEGEGAEVRYPGPKSAYRSLWSDCSQDTLARFEIFVSLNHAQLNGERYNIADSDQGENWEQVWPGLCAFFGLKGLPPLEGDSRPRGVDWVMSHKDTWSNFEEAKGLRKGSFASSSWPLLTILLCQASYDRQYSLEKARSLGFTENKKTVLDGYLTAFARMRQAKMIP